MDLVIACQQKRDKPLPKPMTTHFFYEYLILKHLQSTFRNQQALSCIKL